MTNNKYLGEAKRLTNIVGWVCMVCKKYHGDSEYSHHMATFCCHTHVRCGDCGADYERNAYCETCRRKRERERWEKREKHPWPKDLAVNPVILDDDWFIFSEDEFSEWAQGAGVLPEDVELEIGEADSPPTISLCDQFEDRMPENETFDEDGAISDEVNAIIAKHWKPVFVASGKAIDWRTIPSELLEGTE